MEDIKFKIFGSNWTIKFKDKVFITTDDGQQYALGLADPGKRVLWISTECEDGTDIPLSEVRLTVLHEMIHAYFVTGQYLSCHQDEPLVEWLARCINAMIESKTIDKLKNLNGREKK